MDILNKITINASRQAVSLKSLVENEKYRILKFEKIITKFGETVLVKLEEYDCYIKNKIAEIKIKLTSFNLSTSLL